MPQNLSLKGKDVWTVEGWKKDCMLMQSQVFRNSDMKAEMETNATKEDFFLIKTPQTDFFFCFSLCGEKDFPPEQFFIRRLTEQACPLALTLYSLIPPQSFTPQSPFFSLTHTRIYIYTLWTSHTT